VNYFIEFFLYLLFKLLVIEKTKVLLKKHYIYIYLLFVIFLYLLFKLLVIYNICYESGKSLSIGGF